MSLWTRRRREVVRPLIDLYGDRCLYCGVQLDPESQDVPPSPSMRTVDHVVPRSLGGGDGLDNLALACNLCNQAKADLTLEEFIPDPERRKKLGWPGSRVQTSPDRSHPMPQQHEESQPMPNYTNHPKSTDTPSSPEWTSPLPLDPEGLPVHLTLLAVGDLDRCRERSRIVKALVEGRDDLDNWWQLDWLVGQDAETNMIRAIMAFDPEVGSMDLLDVEKVRREPRAIFVGDRLFVAFPLDEDEEDKRSPRLDALGLIVVDPSRIVRIPAAPEGGAL